MSNHEIAEMNVTECNGMPQTNAQYFITGLINNFGYTHQEIAEETHLTLETIVNIKCQRTRNPAYRTFQKIAYLYWHNFCFGRQINEKALH